MNQKIENIIKLIQSNQNIADEEKNYAVKALQEVNKELEITAFKLDRTEKVKKTTSILLEETIEELEQKRKAVEAQNRELEIEKSLEKVRTIAMAMRKPDDMLEVCKTISLQLEFLGVAEIRNVQTAIFYENRGTYMNYEYYAKHDKTFITETTYTNNELHQEFAEKMLKGKGEFFITHINGKEVIDWIAYQKTTNVFIDNFLETASSLNYYWFSLGPVALGISTYQPLAEEEINLFKRFLKVFELSYQRYLDIEKAEAQARESEIQLALERVRARSLAMHNTSELQEVVNLLAQQLYSMNLDINGGVWIAINDQVDNGLQLWASGGMAEYVQKVNVPFLDSPIFIELRNAIKRKNNFFTEERSDEEKIILFKHLFNFPPWNSLPQQKKEELLSRKGGYTRSVAISSLTSISITNHNGKKFSDEDNEILKRFGNVFEQSYIRFLDLQKAEAQAREAQIEAALERVRSRSMAMFNSADLSAVVFEMFTELIKLDAQLDRCIIMIVDPNTLGINWYLSGKEGLLSNNGFFVQNNSHPSHNAYLDGWRTKRKKWQYHLAGEEKKNWDEFGFTQTGLAKLPDFIKADMSAVESIHLTISSDDFGSLIASSLSPLSEAHANIVERFTKVFNQTYTRFLDLQKAETQKKIIQAENERKSMELEEARKLQFAMLPKELPKLSKLDIAVYMQTATEVGGDYYDFSTKDNGSLNICLGDATGHGLKAGTLVSMMKSLFVADSARLDIKQFFISSNETLKKMALSKMMIAFSMVNIYGREIKIVNAGIPPVFIYRKDIDLVEEVSLHGLPLGAMRKTDYEVFSTELNSGDTILLLSDGLPELQNADEEMYGYERLKRILNVNGNKSSGEIISALEIEAKHWKGDMEQNDDITFIAVKVK